VRRRLAIGSVVSLLLLGGCFLDRSGSRHRGDPPPPGMDAGDSDNDAGSGDGTDAGPIVGTDAGGAECTEGDARAVPCGMCGEQGQRCVGGTWEPIAPCEEMPPCPTGMVETQSEACGLCGTRERTRTCLGCPGWGEWGAWGECSTEGVCSTGETRTRTEGCGRCGTRTVTERCDAACGWMVTDGGTCEGDVSCPRSLRDPICPGESTFIACFGGGSWCRCEADGSYDCVGSCDP